MKEAGAEKLLGAIRHVLHGQVYLSNQMSLKVQNKTDREFET